MKMQNWQRRLDAGCISIRKATDAGFINASCLVVDSEDSAPMDADANTKDLADVKHDAVDLLAVDSINVDVRNVGLKLQTVWMYAFQRETTATHGQVY